MVIILIIRKRHTDAPCEEMLSVILLYQAYALLANNGYENLAKIFLTTKNQFISLSVGYVCWVHCVLIIIRQISCLEVRTPVF